MPIIGITGSGGGKPVVTGGTLTSDATYYYRTFTSNGTLTVTGGSLSAEFVNISGGGGGSNGQYQLSPFQNVLCGGGGGAGGMPTSAISDTFTPGSYSVTIGAGGTSALVGSATTFKSYSVSGGGAFQTNGACGQGETGWNNNGSIQVAGPGAGESGNGTAGGNFNGVFGSSSSRGGGGGGRGGAGGIGTGGSATSAFSTWASVTGTGVSGAYAGGGGGGGGGTGGGGGATNGTHNTNASNATANTGSGGGGANSSSATAYFGGNGGSGIVIVRYTKVQVD